MTETTKATWRRGVGAALAGILMVSVAAGGSTAQASGMPPLGRIGAPGMVGLGNVGTAAENAAEGMPVTGQRFWLRLHHTHTGEDINIVYRIGNTYLPEAMEKLNYFLRDHRTQDVANYDPQEFDVLHSIMQKLRRPNGVIDIVCGYRTPESNEYLRTRSAETGVAEHSQHMLSKAIDIQVPGASTLALRNAALSLEAGGVGYYPTSHFVHVDVGPVREWQYGGRRVRLRSVAGRRGRAHVRHRRS